MYAEELGLSQVVAIDAKLASYSEYDPVTLFSHAQRFDMLQPRCALTCTLSGPTHDQQPPFVWSKSPYNFLPHLGMPDTWDFGWVEISW